MFTLDNTRCRHSSTTQHWYIAVGWNSCCACEMLVYPLRPSDPSGPNQATSYCSSYEYMFGIYMSNVLYVQVYSLIPKHGNGHEHIIIIYATKMCVAFFFLTHKSIILWALWFIYDAFSFDSSEESGKLQQLIVTNFDS